MAISKTVSNIKSNHYCVCSQFPVETARLFFSLKPMSDLNQTSGWVWIGALVGKRHSNAKDTCASGMCERR